MAHARTQIRQAVATALAVTGYAIIPGRIYPVPRGSTDTVTVGTREEEHDPADDDVAGIGATAQGRTLACQIQAYKRTPGDAGQIDDGLDAMCLAIERALGADPTLGGLAEWMTILGTDYEVDGEGEHALGVATLIYRIEYRTKRDDPEQIAP